MNHKLSQNVLRIRRKIKKRERTIKLKIVPIFHSPCLLLYCLCEKNIRKYQENNQNWYRKKYRYLFLVGNIMFHSFDLLSSPEIVKSTTNQIKPS